MLYHAAHVEGRTYTVDVHYDGESPSSTRPENVIEIYIAITPPVTAGPRFFMMAMPDFEDVELSVLTSTTSLYNCGTEDLNWSAKEVFDYFQQSTPELVQHLEQIHEGTFFDDSQPVWKA